MNDCCRRAHDRGFRECLMFVETVVWGFAQRASRQRLAVAPWLRDLATSIRGEFMARQRRVEHQRTVERSARTWLFSYHGRQP